MHVPIVGPGRVEEVVRALRGGAVAAIPTDTVYGLAALPDDAAAVAALAALKGRSEQQPIAVLFDSIAAIAPFVEDAAALRALADFWPGALTAVVRVRAGLLHALLIGEERRMRGQHPGERGRDLPRAGRLARQRLGAPVQRRVAAPVPGGAPAPARPVPVPRPVAEQGPGARVDAARALERGKRSGEALRPPVDPAGFLRAQRPGAPERRLDAPGPGAMVRERRDRAPGGERLPEVRSARPDAGVERAEHALDPLAHRRLARTVLGEHARDLLGQSGGRAVASHEREYRGEDVLVSLRFERVLAPAPCLRGESAPRHERRPVRRLLAQRARRRGGRGRELLPDRFERGERLRASRLERFDERLAIVGDEHHVVARAGERDVEARLVGERPVVGVEHRDHRVAGHALRRVHGGRVRVVEVVELDVASRERVRAPVLGRELHPLCPDRGDARALPVHQGVARGVSRPPDPIARAKPHRRGLEEVEAVADVARRGDVARLAVGVGEPHIRVPRADDAARIARPQAKGRHRGVKHRDVALAVVRDVALLRTGVVQVDVAFDLEHATAQHPLLGESLAHRGVDPGALRVGRGEQRGALALARAEVEPQPRPRRAPDPPAPPPPRRRRRGAR